MPYGKPGEEVEELPADNCRTGWFTYADEATILTPLVHTGGVDTIVTNDALNIQTRDFFAPIGVTNVWDASSDMFDFTELSTGDVLDIRLDILVTTTSPNQETNVDLRLGLGGSSYDIHFDQAFFKAAGQHPVNRYNGVYIGDDNTRLNGGYFVFSSDDNATIRVNGWYCKVIIRGNI